MPPASGVQPQPHATFVGQSGSASSTAATQHCTCSSLNDFGAAVLACVDRTATQRVIPLTDEELEARIEQADVPYQFELGTTGVRLRFAFVSLRGHYPDEPDKANQDTYKMVPSFGGDHSKILLGVFDGHGAAGDLAAQFVRDNVEDTLLKLSSRRGSDFQQAYKMTFVQLNQRLQQQTHIDSSLSGTTACAAFLDGDMLHVANVGDSRAVLGAVRAAPGGSALTIVPIPLSTDQTPYRADERARVRAMGGLVMSYSQLLGDAPMHDDWDMDLGAETDLSGDPPRVWEPDTQRPGCAFTRSIGDWTAEAIGVIAEPEITSRRLEDTDRFLVVASDGVWEFLTNDDVVEMTCAYANPLYASTSRPFMHLPTITTTSPV